MKQFKSLRRALRRGTARIQQTKIGESTHFFIQRKTNNGGWINMWSI